MADEAAAPRSRRALLTAAAGAAGALAASAALPMTSALAADPNDVAKGVDNATTATTSISNSGAAGFGVQGSSTTEAGVAGWSIAAPDPLDYPAGITSYTGVFGTAPADAVDALGTGVWGSSADTGVFGDGSIGVWGYGGIGVVGQSASTSAGVLAVGQSATDLALEVQGKVKFSRSGRTTIGSGKSSIKITLAGTTSGSRIFAVLHSNRTGRWVQSVVPTTGSFTVYLNGTVTSATYVAWFVLN